MPPTAAKAIARRRLIASAEAKGDYIAADRLSLTFIARNCEAVAKLSADSEHAKAMSILVSAIKQANANVNLINDDNHLRVLKLMQEIYGEKEMYTVSAIRALASRVSARGEHEEAVRLYDQALRILKNMEEGEAVRRSKAVIQARVAALDLRRVHHGKNVDD